MSTAQRTAPPSLCAPAVEQALLGALLVFQESALARAGELQPEEFAGGRAGIANADIFAAILDEAERGRPWDALTIGARLTGATEYLGQLASQAATDANVAYYAAILRGKKRQRDAWAALGAARKALVAGNEADPGLAVAGVLDALQAFQAVPKIPSLQPMAGDVVPTLKAAEEVAARGDGLAGLSTGFPDLDGMTGGLQAGQLTILAARTSRGKTAFAMQAAYNVAAQKRRVAVFSLEMDRRRLTARMIASVGGLPVLGVLTGRARQMEVQDAARKVAEVGAWLYLDCRGGLSPAGIRAALHQLKPAAELVIVDYLQLMRMPGRQENRQLEVSAISNALKALAMSLNVPVVALSQFSRQADLAQKGARPPRPQLSWLRESGSLEQDADVVLALHDEQPNQTGAIHEVELIALKNRCGPCARLSLWWEPAYVRFSSYAKGKQ